MITSTIMIATFDGNPQTTIISCYSPTNISDETEVKKFYQELISVTKQVSKHNLSHKLRCYTEISGPGKSRNNTREKISYFFHVCWYSQSAADTSLAFGALRSGWWMNGKAFTILNTSCLSEGSRIMVAKALKNPYRWHTVRFKLSKKGKKTSILKEKPKVTYSVALVLAFLSAENENWQLEDLPLVDFDRLPERLLPSVRIELAGANALYDCYSGIVDSLIFIH